MLQAFPLNVSIVSHPYLAALGISPTLPALAPSGEVELLFPSGVYSQIQTEAIMGRGILLWLLGVPIPVILLLALLWR